MLSRCCFIAAASAALPFASTAHGDTGPCFADATLSASHAVVGQPIEHRVRILRRTDVSQTRWAVAPEFSGAVVEALPGGFVEGRVERGGRWFLVYEERRLIFPVQPGASSIGAARLECALAAAGRSEPAPFTVALPAHPLIVEPVRGAPADWSGLVGEISISLHAPAAQIPLGTSLPVIASALGTADLRGIRGPLVETRDAAELISGDDRVEIEPGAPGEPLRVRRTQTFQLVPQRSGRVTVDARPLIAFDPASGRFVRAAASSVVIRVTEAAAPEPLQEANSGDDARAAAPRGATNPFARTVGSALLAGIVVAGIGIATFVRWRKRRSDRPHDSAATRAPARDPARALRDALARRLAPDARPDALTPEEWVALAVPGSPEAIAAALLLELDRARFARGATPPDASQIAAALRGLGEHR